MSRYVRFFVVCVPLLSTAADPQIGTSGIRFLPARVNRYIVAIAFDILMLLGDGKKDINVNFLRANRFGPVSTHDSC